MSVSSLYPEHFCRDPTQARKAPSSKGNQNCNWIKERQADTRPFKGGFITRSQATLEDIRTRPFTPVLCLSQKLLLLNADTSKG